MAANYDVFVFIFYTAFSFISTAAFQTFKSFVSHKPPGRKTVLGKTILYLYF